MSYTMHSPSQGYSNASADVYASRAYGSHLMAQNYTAYLNRDDPYSGNATSHFPNVPAGLQAMNYSATGSMPQTTYPTLPPISHFPHQQDVYASCVGPARNLSYPPTPAPTSLPRHALLSKGYWNCDSAIQQQTNCYTSSNSISSGHKTSPQAWSHSPNLLSSPSSTPSPIPCPSTPHHFVGSPHHSHSQSHSEGHKTYNGLLNNTSLSGSGSTGANHNCGNNPLQSLQKMVQIESENNDIRVQYETDAPLAMGNVGQHPSAQSTSTIGPLEADPNYPTYYNLDQNRMCATPHSGYTGIPAQSLNAAPFSPTTLKNSQEMRPQSHQSTCSKQENGSENGADLTLGRAPGSARFPSKLSKENSFVASRSCSTDTVGSNGSPPAAPSKASSVAEPLIQAELTHDSTNSFRGSETANSRDSVKSTDSEGQSTYAARQSPTPTSNNASNSSSTNWKLNPAATPASKFRPANFATSTQSKSWWPEGAISPSSVSRSFTPHLADCSQFAGSPAVSYPSPQVAAHSGPQGNSSGSHASSQSWSQQQQANTLPAATATPQMLTGPSANFTSDGVVVKKKRGRPFGSKNRRNLENPQPTTEAAKRKRKSVLVDTGVNTTLSFDVQTSLYQDDSLVFESTVKHTLPLVGKRKKVVGPVVRIDKTNGCHAAQAKYCLVNASAKSDSEDSKDDIRAKAPPPQPPPPPSRVNFDSRKNGLYRKGVNLFASNATSGYNKHWLCVLCHKGPHYKGLGDLYGPYTIQLDKSKMPGFVESEATQEPGHEEATENATEHSAERRSLRRRGDSSASEAESKGKQTINASVTHSEDDSAKEGSLEVWIHEDCIVWSNNVYLDGTDIRNLEPAIVESFNNICTKCKCFGATLTCFYKNCNVSPLHYLCAKDKDCDLDEEKFILSCSKHKKRRIAPKEIEVVEVSEATTTANET